MKLGCPKKKFAYSMRFRVEAVSRSGAAVTKQGKTRCSMNLYKVDPTPSNHLKPKPRSAEPKRGWHSAGIGEEGSGFRV